MNSLSKLDQILHQKMLESGLSSDSYLPKMYVTSIETPLAKYKFSGAFKSLATNKASEQSGLQVNVIAPVFVF